MNQNPLENITTIFFQGESGAYSDLAASILFPSVQKRIGQSEFSQIYASLMDAKEKSIAVLPIENSIFGSVYPVYDLLQKHQIYIHQEFKLKIEHCLLGNQGAKLENLTKVFSHPQALGQCATFFNNHPHLVPVSWYDTAGSAKHVSENKSDLTIGAIASNQAAKVHGLTILKSNIESFGLNVTRFIVVSLTEFYLPNADKTSLIFETKNEPGVLYHCLGVFAKNEIDLLKIESRPIWGKPWEHLFYLDIRGSYESDKIKNAIKQLDALTKFVRILGSFKEYKTEYEFGNGL